MKHGRFICGVKNLQTAHLVFTMLSLILLSHLVHTFVRGVSISLIQVGLGVIYVSLPFSIRINLEAEIFILIFIAPILFMDGKRFSSKELMRYKSPILGLVVGLVFVNVLLVGFLIHRLMGLPLPVAFALAAVLSPTDAVAVKAITSGVNLPHRVGAVIEGESMFNDASGVVAFNFAILAAITGIFNPHALAGSFIYIAIGGLLIGVIFAFVVQSFAAWLKKLGVDQPDVYALLQLLTPFAVFLAAEHLALSGILAVVACGKTIAILSPKLMTLGETDIRFRTEGAWNIFLFMLSGLAFLLLGVEIPAILRDMIADGFSIPTGLGYVAILTLVMIVLRYIWAYLMIDNGELGRHENSALMALSGARGVLTLAVCLSIPITFVEGVAFFERSLILFVAAGVILLSLIIANIGLPLLLRGRPRTELSDQEAAILAAKSSIRAIRQARNAGNSETADLLIAFFEYQIQDLLHEKRKRVHLDLDESGSGSLRQVLKIGLGGRENELKNLLDIKITDKYALEFISVQIQKQEIERLVEKGKIDSRTAYHLRQKISLEESALFEDDLESVEE